MSSCRSLCTTSASGLEPLMVSYNSNPKQRGTYKRASMEFSCATAWRTTVLATAVSSAKRMRGECRVEGGWVGVSCKNSHPELYEMHLSCECSTQKGCGERFFSVWTIERTKKQAAEKQVGRTEQPMILVRCWEGIIPVASQISYHPRYIVHLCSLLSTCYKAL